MHICRKFVTENRADRFRSGKSSDGLQFLAINKHFLAAVIKDETAIFAKYINSQSAILTYLVKHIIIFGSHAVVSSTIRNGYISRSANRSTTRPEFSHLRYPFGFFAENNTCYIVLIDLFYKFFAANELNSLYILMFISNNIAVVYISFIGISIFRNISASKCRRSRQMVRPGTR